MRRPLTLDGLRPKMPGVADRDEDVAELKIYAKPSSLYRYRPLGTKAAREVRALRENFIYCPAYSAMNDPMEGLHRLSSRFSENPGSEKSRDRIQQALEKMGIASMSEVYDHEPMWAHYADQFAGMCVQYSLNRLIKGLDRDVAISRWPGASRCG